MTGGHPAADTVTTVGKALARCLRTGVSTRPIPDHISHRLKGNP
jgi:hypothetical protein